MLTPRPHPLKATPQVFCDYEKASGEYVNDSRWLLPVPLVCEDGDKVDWPIAHLMAEGKFPLPTITHKTDLNTFLKRRPGKTSKPSTSSKGVVEALFIQERIFDSHPPAELARERDLHCHESFDVRARVELRVGTRGYGPRVPVMHI